MRHARGITLTDTLVALLLLAVVTPLALAAMSRQERAKASREAAMQVRSILQGLAVWAEENQNRLPGEVHSGVDGTVATRLQALVEGRIINADVFISPVEGLKPWDPETGEPLTHEHYSYALQSVRTAAWRNDINAAAVFVSDRNTGKGNAMSSVWTEGTEHPTWAGIVGWGDTHVTLEEDPKVSTNVRGKAAEDDLLFDDEDHAQLTFLSNAEGEEVAVPRREDADGGEAGDTPGENRVDESQPRATGDAPVPQKSAREIEREQRRDAWRREYRRELMAREGWSLEREYAQAMERKTGEFTSGVPAEPIDWRSTPREPAAVSGSGSEAMERRKGDDLE